MIEHIQSTQGACWQPAEVQPGVHSEDTLSLTGKKAQTVRGFGGCFNELGWHALQKLSPEKRQAYFDELFLPQNTGFQFGRLPIGANDFSMQWYCSSEVPGDYELEHFQIDRDKQMTIPFIREALQRSPEMTLFASPWSPPPWMKTRPVYNYGRMRMEEKVLHTYADYFLRFVEAYREQEIVIRQLHVQNEPMADQKFPSCLWSGADMRDFIGGYLGPAVKKSGLPLELWLGTINGPFVDFEGIAGGAPAGEYFDLFENTILSDKQARSYLTGVGFQWGGKHVIEQTRIAYPELRYMQTESECGDGKNSWTQMEYIFRQMWLYFHHGVESYVYWNLALPSDSVSTWGWQQNSLVTVTEDGTLVWQPEFYLMKHLSHFVKKNAKVLSVSGRWSANTIAFQNPDGSVVLEVGNGMDIERSFSFAQECMEFTAELPPHSIHTFCIS